MFNGKRANEGEGAGSASSPPLKRQKIAAVSSSTAVSPDNTAAEILQLQQRLQSAEDENARLQERLQQQEEEIQRLRQSEEAFHKQRFGPSWSGKTTDIDIIDNLNKDCNLPKMKMPD